MHYQVNVHLIHMNSIMYILSALNMYNTYTYIIQLIYTLSSVEKKPNHINPKTNCLSKLGISSYFFYARKKLK
jgi:hypothetical protein